LVTANAPELTQTEATETQAGEGTDPGIDGIDRGLMSDVPESQAEPVQSPDAEGTDSDPEAAAVEARIKAEREAAGREVLERTQKEQRERAAEAEETGRLKAARDFYIQAAQAARQVTLSDDYTPDEKAQLISGYFDTTHGVYQRIFAEGVKGQMAVEIAEKTSPEKGEAFLRRRFGSTREMLAAALDEMEPTRQEQARKGFVSEAEAAKRTQDALREARKRFIENPDKYLSQGSKGSPQSRRDGSGNYKSDDELLLDPATPIETVNAILDRRRGQ